MGKTTSVQPPPRLYRDDPDRDDAASTSSAVPLGGVNIQNDNYHDIDAELPAYEDVANLPTISGSTVTFDERQSNSYSSSNLEVQYRRH